jgi:hypothetical protein
MSGGHTRLIGIVVFFQRVDVTRIKAQRFKDGARRAAVIQHTLRHPQAMGGVREIIESTQPGVRQMNVGGVIVALAPALGGAFNIGENRRRNRCAIGRGQQREHLLLTALQAFQLAGTVGRQQDGTSAKHQA